MSSSVQYILKRFALLLITMLLVSLLTFLAFELVSGDPARTILGVDATDTQLAALRHELGLDRSLPVRYLHWLGGFFTGDLGVSYSYRQPVWSLISGKLELTLWLSLMSFLLITVISIPLGIFSYRYTNGFAAWPRTTPVLASSFPSLLLRAAASVRAAPHSVQNLLPSRPWE